ncbi:MAG: hypothetical protein ACTSRU_20645 [Candidatus Hodarchaeales archaeon]
MKCPNCKANETPVKCAICGEKEICSACGLIRESDGAICCGCDDSINELRQKIAEFAEKYVKGSEKEFIQKIKDEITVNEAVLFMNGVIAGKEWQRRFQKKAIFSSESTALHNDLESILKVITRVGMEEL